MNGCREVISLPTRSGFWRFLHAKMYWRRFCVRDKAFALGRIEKQYLYRNVKVGYTLKHKKKKKLYIAKRWTC